MRRLLAMLAALLLACNAWSAEVATVMAVPGWDVSILTKPDLIAYAAQARYARDRRCDHRRPGDPHRPGRARR
jgi:hypothetical protein